MRAKWRKKRMRRLKRKRRRMRERRNKPPPFIQIETILINQQ